MSNAYDDGRYGKITRSWFGLTDKVGGHTTTAFIHSGSATTKTWLARWYPKGPIKIVKMGWQILATASAIDNATGASDMARMPIELWKSGNDGTTRQVLVASDAIKFHPTESLPALWAIGSKETIASAKVEAGRFLTIFVATSESNEGTQQAARTSISTSGSYAVFIDWVPKFSSKWDTA